MPEYLAPGVYVEETSFRSKSIEGVSTTTTGFIGPSRYGPTDIEPDVITSLGQFERTYGDRQQLKFTNADGTTTLMHNYLWHAARNFFEEGGKRLYVVRVFKPISNTNDGKSNGWLAVATAPNVVPPDTAKPDSIRISSRFPGTASGMRIRLTLRVGQNIFSGVEEASPPASPPGNIERSVGPLLDGDLVWISDVSNSPPTSPPDPLAVEQGNYYIAQTYPDPVTQKTNWRFRGPLGPGYSSTASVTPLELSALVPRDKPSESDKIRIVTMTITVMPAGDSDLTPLVYENLALNPGHKRAGEPDSIFDKFAARPSSIAQARRIPIVIERGTVPATGSNPEVPTRVGDALEVLNILFARNATLRSALDSNTSTDAERSIDLALLGGNDGMRPEADEYEGMARDTDSFKTGLKSFEDIEDISIIAAPGSTFGYENGYRKNGAAITNLLISHAERMRYRIAVLDSGDNQSIADVRAMRARVDSKYAALYYPWIRVLDPVTRQEIVLPPSGFVAGIYARNDIQRAVYKAPANEVVNSALGFEILLNKAQQEVLNPEGINCFRFFEGRGFRLWGARTISSDPEWKYVNLRRYFAYLERSVDRGTQWAVFEPNGEALWANVRRTVEDFLFNEFQMGALLGDKPDKAYFVRCDRSTMTQNDLDNGRLVCLIGVAPLRPAEFVIFRIGQWTGDRKV
jgi:phage tail sheath protein FI